MSKAHAHAKMGRPSLGDKPACAMEHCDGVARSHATPICGNCYQSLRYHMNLGTSHIVQWQLRLAKWSARASSVGAGQVGKLGKKLKLVAGGRR